MTEAQEQEAVVEYCDILKIPIFHIPNGGKRKASEAAHLKRQGVRAGVPDLFVPVACGQYHGLFIEMKAGKNKPTEKQIKWLSLLREQGYCAYVCVGSESAMRLIRKYLEGRT